MIRYAFGSTILKTAVLPQTDLVNENESYWRAGWPYRKTGSLDIDTRVNAEAEIGVTRLQAKDRQRRPAKQRREPAKGPGASSPSRISAGSGPADTPSLDPWPPGPEDGNLLRGSRPVPGPSSLQAEQSTASSAP